MKVTEIRVDYGMTQNLGDYSNVKLAVSLTAAVEDGDDEDDVRAHLLALARQRVQGEVDDALEANGLEVIYYQGPRYRVRYNKVRGCVVIFPADADLPDERTWKTHDNWQYSSLDLPGHNMRPHKAEDIFLDFTARHPDLKGVSCLDGDFSKLPPLPDPGPEPLWHSKGLEGMLKSLNIDEALWDELAALDHVTRDFLFEVQHALGWDVGKVDQRLAAIRSGVLPGQAGEDDVDEERYSVDYDVWDDEEEEDEGVGF